MQATRVFSLQELNQAILQLSPAARMELENRLLTLRLDALEATVGEADGSPSIDPQEDGNPHDTDSAGA